MNETRRNRRHRTFKGGKIVFNDNRSVIDCTIRNLSSDGAGLQVESTLGIPSAFNLIIGPDNLTKACDVMWRTKTQLGVAFREKEK